VPRPKPTEICRLEFVELIEIVGLVPLLSESQVDDLERNVIGESPIKLGGLDVRFYSIDCAKRTNVFGEEKN
jgi:hypothetical protein